MSTLRDYFDFDNAKYFLFQPSEPGDWSARTLDGRIVHRISVDICVAYHEESNSTHLSAFCEPIEGNVGHRSEYVRRVVEAGIKLDEQFRADMSIQGGFEDILDSDSKTSIFTRWIRIYWNEDLNEAERGEIVSCVRGLGLTISLRCLRYQRLRSMGEKPLAFVSHDSRDKVSIVRPLVEELSKLSCPIWYDDFSLRVGQSLRESIERGLKETSRFIIVLTPNFLSKGGWPKAEYNAAFTKEIVEGQYQILPVWADVSRYDVFQYSPVLADRVAVSWSIGAENVAQKLRAEIFGARDS